MPLAFFKFCKYLQKFSINLRFRISHKRCISKKKKKNRSILNAWEKKFRFTFFFPPSQIFVFKSSKKRKYFQWQKIIHAKYESSIINFNHRFYFNEWKISKKKIFFFFALKTVYKICIDIWLLNIYRWNAILNFKDFPL